MPLHTLDLVIEAKRLQSYLKRGFQENKRKRVLLLMNPLEKKTVMVIKVVVLRSDFEAGSSP